jgi:ubiquinone/menaquinone biosynthesis C-methylase UbiE
MVTIRKEIKAYYGRGGEVDRLSAGRGELERVRTQDILARYLPPSPATVLDVGGAAGVYAFPLAEAGYQVHLIDPVDLHLEQAREHSAKSGVALASITMGDARRLAFGDQSVDAALLFGPLYHLTERPDRVQALKEARRVLRRDGCVAVAAISRFSPFVDALLRGFFRYSVFQRIIAGDLATGRHENPSDNNAYFTTAYFHRPEELRDEVREAGFDDVRLLAVEGIAWSATHFGEAWDDPEQRSKLMDFLSRIEAEPSLLGASAHFIAVARRAD